MVEDCVNITTGGGADPYCGDGECNGDEDFGSCPEDCEEPGECTSDVCLSFSNFNESEGSVDIWMDNTVDVAGYQIELDWYHTYGGIRWFIRRSWFYDFK